ncbi:hypothetical protein [Streptomyces gossypiisoli]|uniref:hypothetical protein n=1 Tax=Streptomyces gossypiisoli TaxID=2748864 RepID=UPI0015DA48F1|nr:hypothetical protein [Streptomyces gossypiisoli]
MPDAGVFEIAPCVVETTVDDAEGSVRVRVDVYPAQTPCIDDGTRVMHHRGPAGDASSSVVVADATEATGADAFDLLERIVREHPGTFIVGVATSRQAALVWVRVQPASVWEPTGYTVRVSSDDAAPAELFPSAVYGWARWWLARLTVPDGFPRGLLLARPPAAMDLDTGEDVYQLEIVHADKPGTYSFAFHDPEDPTEHR